MWLNLLIDDFHFNNIAKINKPLNVIILEKIKSWNSSKIGHILRNGNNIVKDWMNVYLNSHWIYIDYRSIETKKHFKIYSCVMLF
jgi:hypothetical protein